MRLCSFFLLSGAVLLSATVSAKTLIFQSEPRTPSQPERAASVSGGESRVVQPATPSVNGVKNYSTVQNNVNGELVFIIEQLKQEISHLRGQLEEQSFRLQQLEKSSKKRYQDLDARVLNLSKSTEPQVEPRTSVAPNQAVQGVVPAAVIPVATDEQKLAYRDAYQLVQDKKFEAAVDRLHAYIEKFPEGELTGNAYYWLGEVYLVLPQLEQAQQAFNIVVKAFPGHRKEADAMFKLAVTYDRLQDPVNSEKFLKLVRNKFPNSTAAKLANSYKISR